MLFYQKRIFWSDPKPLTSNGRSVFMWLSMTEKKNERVSQRKGGERESYQSSFSTQWPVFQAGLKKKTPKTCTHSCHNNDSLFFPKQCWPCPGSGLFSTAVSLQTHRELSLQQRYTADAYLGSRLPRTLHCIIWLKLSIMHFPPQKVQKSTT